MVAILAFSMLTAFAGAGETYRSFGDWASVCDNGLRCQVSSQMGQAANMGVQMRLRRAPGPRSTIEVSFSSSSALGHGPRSLDVDGPSFALVERGRELVVPLRSAVAAARALASGSSVHVTVARERFPISARGSAAALRDMDVRQRRSGTVTAIVAMGAARASSVPPPPALPIRTESRRPRNGLIIRPSARRLAEWRQAEDCREPLDPLAHRVESWAIDERGAVILILCQTGAHNNYVLVKVGSSADGRDARAADFDFNASFSERSGPSVPPIMLSEMRSRAGSRPGTAAVSPIPARSRHGSGTAGGFG
jgi:hypothetical protein